MKGHIAAMGKENNQPLTSIVMLTWNQLSYTRKCIQSVFQYTDVPFELIFIDNGSTDGTIEFINSCRCNDVNCKGIKLIANTENMGFARGCNQGLSIAAGKYLLLLNNDVVVTPNWLSGLINALQKWNIDLVGPMSNHVSGPQVVKEFDYDPGSLEGLKSFSSKHAVRYNGQIEKNWRLAGFCLLFRRRVLDKIGGLDYRYNIGNFEDDDFCIRSFLAGFRGAIAKDCYIHHFGGRTFIGNEINYGRQIEKNWELFKEKWGIPSTTSYGERYQIPIPVCGFKEDVHVINLMDGNLEIKDKIKSVDDDNSLVTKEKQATHALFHKRYEKQCEADRHSGGTLMQIYDQVFEVVSKHIPEDEKEVISWILERILEYTPHHGKSHHELGLLFYEKGEMAKAQSHLHQAVRFSPNDPAYFKDLGDFYHVVHKDAPEALKLYEKALGLDPNNSQLLLAAGHFCVMEHKFDLAREYYRRVLTIEPNNSDAANCLHKIENQISPNNPSPFFADDSLQVEHNSDRFYPRSPEMEPGITEIQKFTNEAGSELGLLNDMHVCDTSGLYQKAQTMAEKGRLQEGIDCMLQLLVQSPQNALYHNDIGVLYYRSGDKNKALACYEQAVQLDPYQAVFQKNLADFYLMELARLEDAMKLYVKVLEQNPQDIDCLLATGLVCINMDKEDDARVFFQRVLEIEPWNQSALQALDQLDGRNPIEGYQNYKQAMV